jgi:hypothetical protein
MSLSLSDSLQTLLGDDMREETGLLWDQSGAVDIETIP